jgi:hypothetical protein
VLAVVPHLLEDAFLLLPAVDGGGRSRTLDQLVKVRNFLQQPKKYMQIADK